jgi:hypothetical protein
MAMITLGLRRLRLRFQVPMPSTRAVCSDGGVVLTEAMRAQPDQWFGRGEASASVIESAHVVVQVGQEGCARCAPSERQRVAICTFGRGAPAGVLVPHAQAIEHAAHRIRQAVSPVAARCSSTVPPRH